jgi:hypothetical protein
MGSLFAAHPSSSSASTTIYTICGLMKKKLPNIFFLPIIFLFDLLPTLSSVLNVFNHLVQVCPTHLLPFHFNSDCITQDPCYVHSSYTAKQMGSFLSQLCNYCLALHFLEVISVP